MDSSGDIEKYYTNIYVNMKKETKHEFKGCIYLFICEQYANI